MPRFAIVGADIALMAFICISLVAGPPAFKTSAQPASCPHLALSN